MTLLEGLQKQVQVNLKGSQVFCKETILETIQEYNLFFANEIKLDSDEQGEHLILTFDECIVCFELIWEQEGPRYTLVEIRLA